MSLFLASSVLAQVAETGGGGLNLSGSVSTPNNESETLDMMVVTASRSAESLREVSQSMVVITQREIRESASDNVLDLLTHYGFQVTNPEVPNYDGSMLRMRGLSSSNHGIDLNGEILVLIDGRRTGTDSFGILDMNAIARIEVVRGPGAMQYGSSAIGGVVNVITERGSKETDITLEAGIGSWSAKTAKAFASGQSNDGRFDYAVSASRYSIDDYEDGKGVRNLNSALDSRQKYAVNLGWNIDKDHRIGLAAQHTDTDRAGIGASDATASSRKQYKDSDYQAFDLSYEGRAQNKSWLLRYFTGRTGYELTREVSATNPQMVLSSEYDNKFQGAQGTFNLDTDRFGLVAGVDYLHYDLDQSQLAPIVTLARQNNTKGKYTNIGAFAIGKAYLLEEHNLVLSAGLRYDTFKSDMKTRWNLSVPKTLDISSTHRKFLPSLGVAYHPLDYLKLRANYGHAFKMPAPREQGGAFFMASTQFVGNPDLKPEQSKTWDIGFDANYRTLNVYATYFDTHYRDRIAALPTASLNTPYFTGNGRLYVNLDKVYLRGVEMGGDFNLGRHFNWGFDLSPYLAMTRMTKYEDNTGEKVNGLAKINASFGLRFHQPAEKLSANLDFVYYGETRGYEHPTNAPAIEHRVGGRTIANLRFIKGIAGFGSAGNLKLKVAVDNLFNKYYRSTRGDPADNPYLPGRSFYVGLVYDLK
jgi:vitamin B12 transporter